MHVNAPKINETCVHCWIDIWASSGPDKITPLALLESRSWLIFADNARIFELLGNCSVTRGVILI